MKESEEDSLDSENHSDVVFAKNENPSDKSKEVFPCETCLKIFSFNNDIQDDMCDFCKVKIADNENIRLPKIYHCDICEKNFETKTLFNEHNCCTYMDSPYSFACEDCHMKWTEENPFEEHMRKKHTRHVCVRCRATLKGKDNLDAHFKMKHRAF